VLLAVGGANRDAVESALRSQSDVHLAMDNCPNQIVLCGPDTSLAKVIEPLKKKGAICFQLPFKRAYHSPLFGSVCGPLEKFYQSLDIKTPHTKLYSCSTAATFPDDPVLICQLVAAQWASPVRFRETIEAMYKDEVRIFVEVGPRNNLTAFVDDILRGKRHLAIASNVAKRSAITQLNHLLAFLAAHHVPMQLDYLYSRRMPEKIRWEKLNKPQPHSDQNASFRRLATGLQPLRLRRTQPPVDSSVFKPDAPVGSSQPEAAGNGSTGRREGSVETFFPRTPLESPADPRRTHTPLPPETSSVPVLSFGRSSSMVESSSVVKGYLSTMERFLDTQQVVMRTFLQRVQVERDFALDGDDRTRLGVSEYDTVDRDSRNAASLTVSAQSSEPVSPQLPSALQVSVEQSNGDSQLDCVRARSLSEETLRQKLLALVSERTGYPMEMLNLNQDLEADLGIDSIKRVEVLGALQKQIGVLDAEEMDHLMRLKTLVQIIGFLIKSGPDNGTSLEAPLSEKHSLTSQTTAAQDFTSFPFVGTVTKFVPNQSLTALRELNIEEDLFLKDHTLGRRVSVADEGLLGLPIVPLTVSMEMLAEAGAAVVPG